MEWIFHTLVLVLKMFGLFKSTNSTVPEEIAYFLLFALFLIILLIVGFKLKPFLYRSGPREDLHVKGSRIKPESIQKRMKRF